MADAEQSVTVSVDVDHSRIDAAIDAVHQLEDALDDLESRAIDVSVDGPQPEHGETILIDEDAAQELGDRAADAVGDRLGVDPDRVHVYALDAPNRVRYGVERDDGTIGPLDTSDTADTADTTTADGSPTARGESIPSSVDPDAPASDYREGWDADADRDDVGLDVSIERDDGDDQDVDDDQLGYLERLQRAVRGDDRR